MKRPLATLVTLMLVTTLFVGFAAGPAAAQCSSTATGTNVNVGPAIDVSQTAIQVNLANTVQTGTATSIGGDATVVQIADTDQVNLVDQDTC